MPSWLWPRAKPERNKTDAPAEQAGLTLARETLRDLLADKRVPDPVRESLADDYQQVQRMLDKLEHGHIHIAVFGQVSVGKSSLLNALIGEQKFSTGPLHGETRSSEIARWNEYQSGGVFLIDTPGINEIGGAERERLAREVAGRSDLVIFVAAGDLTETELAALKVLSAQNRPLLLALNKSDRYSKGDIDTLRRTLAERTSGLVDPRNIVAVAADPAARTVIVVDEQGQETESERAVDPDIGELKDRLWEILEAEGQTLAALNASLFAGGLSDQIARRVFDTRRKLGERVVRTYCLSKGVAVALNPVPVADLFAAAFIDGTMIWHLSRLYDLPVTRSEAGSLVKVIVTQMAALMGTVWAVHMVSAALKVGTAGMSVLVTAGAQGAVAYYSTYVVGKVAERYLVQGKSWGAGGPKQVVKEILDNLDRDSILAEARADIRARLKATL